LSALSNPDGWVRMDFPGGWKTDTFTAFKPKDLNQIQQQIFNRYQTWIKLRKSSSFWTSGSYTHSIPIDGLYIMKWKDKGNELVALFNFNSSKSLHINAGFLDKYFSYPLVSYTSVFDDFHFGSSKNIKLGPWSSIVLIKE